MKQAVVLTHRRPGETAHALGQLVAAARAAGVELRFSVEETAKHDLREQEGIVIDADADDVDGADLCVVLGGDGTILGALRSFSGTDVPVFAVNFGQVGFLSTIEADACEEGFERAFTGAFEILRLPAIGVEAPSGVQRGINDVSVTRKVGERVAMLSYVLQGVEVGSVRCDGLVVSTAAGSTGYNLANGGPVLAWGVEGFVVSFVAPHSLTARPLVVAPNDTVEIRNNSPEEPVDVAVDGRPAGELGPGEALTCRFVPDTACLAQVPGTTFYRRLRDKFGHLV